MRYIVSHWRIAMTIGLGRRQLVIRLVSPVSDDLAQNYPMATAATDSELARLNHLATFSPDRVRWEMTAKLYGANPIRS
jgi:hypothetical protein